MALDLKNKVTDLISKIKEGGKFSPQGQIASKTFNASKKLALGTGAVFGAVMLYFLKLGAAAAKGALIGATIGGTVGATAGTILGFQIGLALAPYTFGLSIPVFTVLGGVTGGFVGATIGAVAGGLIGLGIASGSTTATSMGVGAGVGGAVGAYAGFTAGTIIASTFTTLAIAACVSTLIGCVLVPIAVVSSPIIIAVSTAIGAVGGALAGAALGYVVDKYVFQTATNLASNSVQGIKGLFQGSGGHGEYASSGTGIGHGINAGLSAAGNLITGVGSWAWNGIVGGAGNAISVGSSLFSNGLSLLSGTSASASTAGLTQVAVGGAIGTVATATIVAGIVTNAAFFSPTGEIKEDFPDQGQNEFFAIEKTASPTQLATSGSDVTFTITVSAKNQAINSIGFIDNFRFQKDGVATALTANLGQCTTPIAAGTSCTLSFTFNTFLVPADSLLINSVVASATMADGSTQSDSASVTVNIGVPSVFCGNITLVNGSATWSDADRTNVTAACSELARAPQMVGFLRNAGTITVIRNTGGCSASVNGANQITINGCDFSNVNVVKYVLIHELGHVVANYNGPVYQSYLNSGAYKTDGLVPTYPFSPSQITWGTPASEGFAEMIADYVVSKYYNYPARGWSNYPGGPWNYTPPKNGFSTFQNNMPTHFNFAKDNLFGGLTY